MTPLHARHAEAILDFRRTRAYFAASVSDRGDACFEQFTERHQALLAEQQAGISACYVLLAQDGSVLGRLNQYSLAHGSADLGYRSPGTRPGAAWPPPPPSNCAPWRRPGTDCTPCARPPP